MSEQAQDERSDLTEVGRMMVANDGYIADGHRLVVAVANGCLTGAIECPGLGCCQARGVENHDICCLQQTFNDVGLSEFSEWQDKPYRQSSLPAEIEWRWDGYGEDSEVWWRPVPPARALPGGRAA